MKRLFAAVLLLLTAPLRAEVVGEELEYRHADTVMKGYIAWDNATRAKRPGVLVVHEWWGHNDYARKRTRQLAAMGYTALAVDMYGDGTQAQHPDEAGKFSSAVRANMPVAEARFRAALDVLHAHPSVNPNKSAAIGYCFGGAVVLEMARRGVDLDAVASFHGSLGTETPAKPGAVKARILVANGADDPFVKPEAIAAFKAEMDAAGVDYTFINYEGAKHSFTNPDADQYGQRFELPLAYNAEVDRASWGALQDLFKKTFNE